MAIKVWRKDMPFWSKPTVPSMAGCQMVLGQIANLTRQNNIEPGGYPPSRLPRRLQGSQMIADDDGPLRQVGVIFVPRCCLEIWSASLKS
jgi:hypothetical protein